MTETIEMIFTYLNQIGFTHPLHPAFTHIPMGMVIGAVVFRFCSLIPKFKGLARTAYHCLVLGFLGLFPTAATAIMDWQHSYQGEWGNLIIIKMVLAVLLAVIMLFTLIKDNPEDPKFNKITGLYVLMLLVAVGLGYSGGELVFG